MRATFGGHIKGLLICAAWAASGVLAGDISPAPALRLGFFPNITHAQALYARATGSFDKALGRKVRWTAFNAGPTAVEAVLANEIDATYIGPGPAINGYVQSHGEAFVVIAGAASGGAALVVRDDSTIRSDKDFNGKTIATPQLGNTQDVSARAWLESKGYRPTSQGGTVNLIALSNPDQLTMFKRHEIDGAWTVEPWVSRLLLEAGGHVFLDEKQLWPDGKYATTELIVTRKYLRNYPEEVRKLLDAHIEATQWITNNFDAAVKILNGEIRKDTSRALRDDVIESALHRVELTWDPVASSLKKDAQEAYEIHFLRKPPDLDRIYDLTPLNQVLTARHLPTVTP